MMDEIDISDIKGEILIKPDYGIEDGRETCLILGICHLPLGHNIPKQGARTKFKRVWEMMVMSPPEPIDEIMGDWRAEDLITTIKWKVPK